MLMLLSVHVTIVLFLVRFNNFGLLLQLHALTLVARSYALLLGLIPQHHPAFGCLQYEPGP